MSKEDFNFFATGKQMESYFENSVEEMFSFFVRENKFDLKEAHEILAMIEKLKKD